MATIKEIAILAGVSRGTVDRVLNNRGGVNPATAKRIRDIALSLNYQPNKAALALAAQKKKLLIGVLLFGANDENPFWEDVMKGVDYQQNKLAGYGCQILVKRTPFDAQAQIDAIDEFCDLGISGLVISPYNAPEIAKKINTLYEMGIPTVTTNTDIENTNRLFYVGSNYYECGCIAAGLMGLLTGGKANVGIITGSPLVLCHTERNMGFLDTISKRYPGIKTLEIVENQDNQFQSYHVTYTLLEKYPELDALCFTAAGAYAGCQAVLNLKREKGIKIISFDAVESIKEMIRRGVISATICQQPFQQGSKPIKLLFDYLTIGICPEESFLYTEALIKIYENI